MRVFGPVAYASLITLPARAIARFAEIEAERDAAQQLARLRLMALADGLEQGKEYVRGKDDPQPKAGAGYYSLKRYIEATEELERRAEPWSAEYKQRLRREREQEQRWAALKAAMGLGK